MRKKYIYLITLLVVILLVGCQGSAFGKYTETRKRSVSGRIDMDGNGILPVKDAFISKVSGDGYDVQITEDRQHVVFLETDGSLSVLTDGGRTTIASDVRSFSDLSNNGVIFTKLKNKGKYYLPNDYSYDSYRDNEYSTFRYSFLTGKNVELMNESSFCISSESGMLLYSAFNEETKKYSVYRLGPSDTEAEVLLSGTDILSPVGISDDGSIYAWAELVGDEYSVYLFANGEKTKALKDTGYTLPDFTLLLNKNQDFAFIGSSSASKVAIWTADGGIVKTNLPNELQTTYVYTDVGGLSLYPDVGAGALYLSTDEGKNLQNLYSITPDGNREKIVGNIVTFEIRNQHLYYITDNEVLYHSKIKNGAVEEPMKIANDVCALTLSPDGSAVAYVRDVSKDQIGSLYYFSEKMEKPVLISGDCYCMAFFYSYPDYYMISRFSNDGSFLYYFTEPDAIKDNGVHSTTLRLFDVKSQESKRIGSEVIPTLGSEYLGGYFDAHAVWYYKFDTYDSEKGLTCDLMLWDGENAVVVASDVRR